MRSNKLYILIIFNILICCSVSAQELHFTQYEKAPSLLNPGLVGQFAGTYRVNGLYRDQYRGSANNPFQTFVLTADLPVIRGFRKRDWIGAGVMLNSDMAGTLGQKMSSFGMNVAYHLGLDKKQTRILSLGVQFSAGSLSYGTPVDRNFASGMLGSLSNLATMFRDGGSSGGSGETGEPRIDGGSLNDLQVGLVYNVRGKNTDLKIGAAVDGILGPERAYRSSGDAKSIGINGFLTYSHPTSKRMSFTHGAFYATQDGASFINVNSRMKYKISKESDMKLIGGLGTRSLRAILFYTGVEFGSWNVGLSYDFDIGGSTDATGGHKAIELGVTYLGLINKTPKPKPIIYCPRI